MKKEFKTELGTFELEIYEEGSTVMNKLSKQSCELNAEQLSVYDYIIGAEILFNKFYYNGNKKDYQICFDNFNKGREWFRNNYLKEYIILLD